MAGTFTNQGAQEILDYIGNGTAIDGSPGTLFIALWTTDPGDTGATGLEITGTGYARTAIGFGSPSSANPSEITNTLVEFNSGNTVGTWNSGNAIPGFAIFTQATLGVMIASGTLDDQTKVVTSGDTASFAVGAITITLT